jgi:hypothetical protein
MAYDPEHDLYELIGLPSDADEGEIRRRLAVLRGTMSVMILDSVALILLNRETRAQYDCRRAVHRVRMLLRESRPIFSGAARVPRENEAA